MYSPKFGSVSSFSIDEGSPVMVLFMSVIDPTKVSSSSVTLDTASVARELMVVAENAPILPSSSLPFASNPSGDASVTAFCN